MEDSCEMHSEDNKALPETNRKRKLKTTAQVEALENFFNESLQLTEKQISGWFCHRRLKDRKLLIDEAYANGRQDRSSGVIQDRGSGLRQDSCGSTKQGDYRHFDPREVESRRFSGQDFSAVDVTYEHGSHYTGNHSGTDDTSSGSSSPLQNKIFNQNEVHFDMTTSRYPTQHNNILPLDAKGVQMRKGPSGYLKVKGQVEHSAITAVKRQLGRHYRADGPMLGVEFQPLPPGAFESSTRDPVNEPYYVGDSIPPHSLDVPRTCKQPNPTMRYEVYNSKMGSHDSELDGTSLKNMHGSDYHENYPLQFKKKLSLPNHSNPFPGRNSSVEMNEDSAGETSIFDSRTYGMGAKHSNEGMRMDSVSSHHLHQYGGKITSEQTEPWLHNYGDVSHKVAQKEYYESKPSQLTLKRGEPIAMEERGMSRKMAKEEKFYGEGGAINEYFDPVKPNIHPANEVAKRGRNEFHRQQYRRKASMVEMLPWTTQIKRSGAEMPSSFSEDETVETSSSMD
ncbi:uncharacterized protein LOC132311494 isoform X2 [Cornus florida]|uniref:uncharacterized protein LOC132311494 isoform X2 n=1 Tax=Cornus florida TaxID=4283 RepID=UPI00289BCFC7|nr:uncharacterized protein LOC132311494 isoform X2 [Cornus florida]